MSTRGQLAAVVRANLADNGVTFFSDKEINDSLQDCYNEIASKSYNIVKSVTLNWQSDLVYYDPVALGVADYLGVIAIFNIATNQWLRDDITLRDFDRLRRNWELWNGMPQLWASHSRQYFAVAPHLLVGSGQFKLIYWAQAPTFFTDNDVPLVAADIQTMFWNYCTADLLESADEFKKAEVFWKNYFEDREEYKIRCKRLCSAELLLRL